MIDPLSDDPLICTGSANFSKNSLQNNDENMVLIRGDTRVADIYLTEFLRLHEHFYFRDAANSRAGKGKDAEGAFLEETKTGPRTIFSPEPTSTHGAKCSSGMPLVLGASRLKAAIQTNPSIWVSNRRSRANGRQPRKDGPLREAECSA